LSSTDYLPPIEQTYTLSYCSPGDPWYKKAVIQPLEALTGRPYLQKLLDQVKVNPPTGPELWRLMLEKLEIVPEISGFPLSQLPEDQPKLLIANHPFGVVDGMVTGYLLSQVSSHYQVMVHEALCKEPLLNPYFLPIDFNKTKKAQLNNLDTRKKALKLLKDGHSLGIFPAGGVSTAPRPLAPAEDLPWKRFVVKLIRQTDALIVPVFFEGQNSRLFHWASMVHPNLRLGLLLYEVYNTRGKNLGVKVRTPIEPSELKSFRDSDQLLSYLRKKVYTS
jgi:putative hemolysin